MPRRLQIEFSQVVQKRTDAEGGELSGAQIWAMFADEYLHAEVEGDRWGRYTPVRSTVTGTDEGQDTIEATIKVDGVEQTVLGRGNGPIAAFIDALTSIGVDVRVLDYAEHAMSAGGDAKAASYVECAVDGRVLWGVGIDPSITTSSLKAIISAVNRALKDA